MTDRKQDIVERLRQDGRMSADLLDDAAAEIERLRAIIAAQWVPKPCVSVTSQTFIPRDKP